MTKQQLRAKLQQRQRAHTSAERKQFLAAGRRLTPLLRRGRPVGRYWSMGTEPDPGLLLAGRGIGREYAPWMGWRGADRLRFRSCPPRRGWHWQKNRYGIVEPLFGTLRSPSALAAILVPLLGFDACGNRLGRGKGHYDIALARCWSRPMLIGVAWDEQRLDSLPAEAHDQPLDAVITPNALFLCSARARRRACRRDMDPIPLPADRARFLPGAVRFAPPPFAGRKGRALVRY